MSDGIYKVRNIQEARFDDNMNQFFERAQGKRSPDVG
jgi:hypothetical protein